MSCFKQFGSVAGGSRFLSSPISDTIQEGPLHSDASSDDDPFESLSPREKEVMKLIAEGYTSAEIGKILFITDKTVEKHRVKLMKKLNARNLAGLVRLAIKYHLVDPDGSYPLGHTPAICPGFFTCTCMQMHVSPGCAGGARELRIITLQKAQFVTGGIIGCQIAVHTQTSQPYYEG